MQVKKLAAVWLALLLSACGASSSGSHGSDLPDATETARCDGCIPADAADAADRGPQPDATDQDLPPDPGDVALDDGPGPDESTAGDAKDADHGPEELPCVPDCALKECGDDGCGGSCGECFGTQEVCQEYLCVCVPDCTGKTCGGDGCGGPCGDPCHLWVDAAAAGAPLQDGTQEHPFESIKQATDVAEEFTLITVLPGTYWESATLNKAHLTLEGQSAVMKPPAPPDGLPGITIKAKGVTVQGFKVDGFPGRGVSAADAAGVTLNDVEVLNTASSPSKKPDQDMACGYSWTSVKAVGVTLAGCPDAALKGVRIRGVTGHDGVSNPQCGVSVDPGTGIGLLVSSSSALTAANCSIELVSGGKGYAEGMLDEVSQWWPGDGAAAAGVDVSTSSNVTLDHVTVFSVTGGKSGSCFTPECVAEEGAALEQAAAATGVKGPWGEVNVTVANSIISQVDGLPALCADGGTSVEFSDLWSCGAVGEGAVVEEVGALAVDPRFEDPADGDLHLKSWSPCVDTGAPCDDCSQEPAPNGCRTDMGRYGNTIEATSAASATHCETCPPASKCEGGICVPNGCVGQTCGDDGCGAVCGTCPPFAGCRLVGCVAGSCEPVAPKPGWCYVDASCYKEGEGSNQCNTCVPSFSQDELKPEPDGKPCETTTGWAEICFEGSCCPFQMNCVGKECGGDGCGGSCGSCADGYVCHEGACCPHAANCVGKICGDDGCGGVCGKCQTGFLCYQNECCNHAANCAGKECGDDGCGDTCGLCPVPFYQCIKWECILQE